MVDILFGAWAVVTVLAFLDLFIPDPLPFVDEIVLFILSGVLLAALALRGIGNFFSQVASTAQDPFVLGFVLTVAGIFIFNKFRRKNK